MEWIRAGDTEAESHAQRSSAPSRILIRSLLGATCWQLPQLSHQLAALVPDHMGGSANFPLCVVFLPPARSFLVCLGISVVSHVAVSL